MIMSEFAIPRNCDIPPGAFGVWQVPELDIMIPVYQPKGGYIDACNVVDAENSATIRKLGESGGRVIEDHADSLSMNGRGRWTVGEFKPDTVGFLITSKGTEQYVCNRVLRAYRHSNGFTCDGIGVWPRSATDILCVGCATADAREVYVAAFKFLKVIP